MQQATLRTEDARATVRALSAECVQVHGVPASLAERASRATLRRFHGIQGAPYGRVKAYFWGVIRRSALVSHDDTAGLRARYLAAALARDLLSAGHPGDRVRDEVARRYGSSLPPDALDRIGCGAA
jgi:hypothetical protein